MKKRLFPPWFYCIVIDIFTPIFGAFWRTLIAHNYWRSHNTSKMIAGVMWLKFWIRSWACRCIKFDINCQSWKFSSGQKSYRILRKNLPFFKTIFWKLIFFQNKLILISIWSRMIPIISKFILACNFINWLNIEALLKVLKLEIFWTAFIRNGPSNKIDLSFFSNIFFLHTLFIGSNMLLSIIKSPIYIYYILGESKDISNGCRN